MDREITLSATYIKRNLNEVLKMVVEEGFKVLIKYKGEICAEMNRTKKTKIE